MGKVPLSLMRKICLAGVDAILIWVRDDIELSQRLDMPLEGLMDLGLYAADHKSALYRKEAKWSTKGVRT